MRAYSGCSATNEVSTAAAAAALLVVGALLVAGCTHVVRASSHGEPSIPDLPPEALIDVGTSVEKLEFLVGKPIAVEKTDEGENTEVWYYDFGMVMIQDGRVLYKWPPSEVVTDVETPQLQ